LENYKNGMPYEDLHLHCNMYSKLSILLVLNTVESYLRLLWEPLVLNTKLTKVVNEGNLSWFTLTLDHWNLILNDGNPEIEEQ
jgi:hypothetical protein